MPFNTLLRAGTSCLKNKLKSKCFSNVSYMCSHPANLSKPRNWYWYKLKIPFHQFYMHSYLYVHVCMGAHDLFNCILFVNSCNHNQDLELFHHHRNPQCPHIIYQKVEMETKLIYLRVQNSTHGKDSGNMWKR